MKRTSLLVGILAMMFVGCGGSDGSGGSGALALLDTAVTKLGDSESFRQAFTMESDLGNERFSMKGEGTSSADSTRARMTADMTLKGRQIAFEGIVLDDVMYLKSDDFPMPAGKTWLKMANPPTSTMQPSEFARFLRESDGVENVGSEEIRGKQTTHFRGPLDLERLAQESGSALVQRLRSTPGAEDLEIMFDMWIAEDGLPARMVGDFSMPDRTSGSMRFRTDILEYDVDVDAEAPPAAEVAQPSG